MNYVTSATTAQGYESMVMLALLSAALTSWAVTATSAAPCSALCWQVL